ncbi:MAG: Fe-S protein assembly co-chaperone HscB [Holosporales bacterium]
MVNPFMSEPEDYFALFGLFRSYDLDRATLDQAYFTAQQRVHPDQVLSQQAGLRDRADELSAAINQAYGILKNPLKRAIYFLHLQGIEFDQSQASPALLNEMFLWRERAEDCASRDEKRKLKVDVRDTLQDIQRALSQAFLDKDSPAALTLAQKMQYLQKLHDDLEEDL